jgi:hypothetical protein
MAAKSYRRAATGTADLENSSGRLIRYLFSDPSVARDNHTIAAWKLGNYERNPVFLWAHQSDEPPIGRVAEVVDQKGFLRGAVEYAERDVYPFADTIFQLVRGGFLNAVSVSWDPIDWSFSTDRSRPGGVDFKLAELLEVSQVPVPALPTALATARSQGIDTGPLFDWAERILDLKPRGLIVPRKTLEQLRKEARMPKARTVAKAKRPMVQAAAAEPVPDPAIVAERAAGITALRRGLYEVAQLAYALSSLGGVQCSIEWEAAIEEDGSEVPAELKAAMKQLGAVLVKMTAEEVAELVADDEADAAPAIVGDLGVRYVVKTAQPLRAETAGRIAGMIKDWHRDGVALVLEPGMRLMRIAGDQVVEIAAEPAAETERAAASDEQHSRAGRVVSAGNAKKLREAHEAIDRGCGVIRSFLDEHDGDDEDDSKRAAATAADVDAEKELRVRKAKARKRKALTLVA